LCAIDNSRRAVYGYDQRVEVFGSQGAVMVGNRTPSQVSVAGGSGVESDLPLYFFIERYEEAYRIEMRHFVECVREKKTPSVTGHDGRAPILLAQAANQAMKEGRAVRVGP
jgi:myo-inositol 2-dehydrogenase/D-chiro-inositol 1-dehydrogenase